VFQTRALVDGKAGTAGLSDDGAFVFQPVGGEKLVLPAAQLEDVRVLGFPARILRLTELTGRMHEFSAGFLLASGAAPPRPPR
jgi:hypothetical protein